MQVCQKHKTASRYDFDNAGHGQIHVDDMVEFMIQVAEVPGLGADAPKDDVVKSGEVVEHQKSQCSSHRGSKGLAWLAQEWLAASSLTYLGTQTRQYHTMGSIILRVYVTQS